MIRTLVSSGSALSYRSRLIFFFLLITVVLIADFLLFRNIKNGHHKPKSLTDLIHDEMPVPLVEPTYLTRQAIFGNIPELNGSSALEQVEVFYNKTLYAPGIILMVKGPNLGTQLFQYACAYTLSRRLRWPLYIYYSPTPTQPPIQMPSWLYEKKRDFALDHFRIPLDNFVDKSTEVAGALLNFGREGVLENTFRMGKRMPKLFLQLNQESTYNKAILYWRRYLDDFRVMFKPRDWAVGDKNLKRIQRKIRRSRESVAVHVSTDKTGYFPKLFYEEAMKKMGVILEERGRAKPVYFLFFSDGKLRDEFEEIGSKVGEEFEMFYQASGKKMSGVEEFYLMGLCSHVIFLRSEGAWWVNYLKEGKGNIGMAPVFNPKFFGRRVGNGSAFQVKMNGKVYGSREGMEEMDYFGGDGEGDLTM